MGEGASAVVKKCSLKKDPSKFYATKVIRRYDVEKEMATKKEYDMMLSIGNHPHIVQP